MSLHNSEHQRHAQDQKNRQIFYLTAERWGGVRRRRRETDDLLAGAQRGSFPAEIIIPLINRQVWGTVLESITVKQPRDNTTQNLCPVSAASKGQVSAPKPA